MISWAIVPTTITERAVEILSQIETRLATRASPSHNAASAQTLVMTLPPKKRGEWYSQENRRLDE
jgi:hypothetical protein